MAMTTKLTNELPTHSTKHLSDEEIDKNIDAVLRASGNALRNFSMQKSKDDMRTAMRACLVAYELRICTYMLAQEQLTHALKVARKDMEQVGIIDSFVDHDAHQDAEATVDRALAAVGGKGPVL